MNSDTVFPTYAAYAQDGGETGSGTQISDLMAAVRRRLWLAGAVATVALVVGLTVVVSLAAQYRSSATILIEQQDIPADYVRSSVTSYADQRIQVISARVMTTANLLEIIRKYRLYAEELQALPSERVVELMREEIEIKTVSADVVDPRSGRPTQATIAFTTAFSSPSPELAQRVANELASLFLNENLRTRKQMATETADFLANEKARLQGDVRALEMQLARFKESNAQQLPEFAQIKLQLMDRTERELLEAERGLSTQRQNVIYLESELAKLPATLDQRSLAATVDGERLLEPSEQLRVLETKLASTMARYSPEHPDYKRLQGEVAALRRVSGASGNRTALQAELASARAALASAERRYAADHPDVRRLRRTVEAIESATAGATARSASAGVAPANPAYLSIRARLQGARAEIRALQTKRDELQGRLRSYEAQLAAGPAVEQQYRTLARDYDNALAKYQEVSAKQMEAEMSASLEAQQKAERFTLIEPPLLPEQPVKPNRAALSSLVAVLALALGVTTTVAAEAMDGSVRGVRGVTRVLGEPPLAAIPRIQTPGQRHLGRLRRVTIVAALLGSVLAALAMVHLHLMPIDVLWFALLGRVLG